MERSFLLEVITPERTFFSGDVTSIILPALDGSCGIMAGHAPMVTAVENGVMEYRTPDGRWHFAAVGRGFAEVMPASTIVLVTTAERSSEIDPQRAERAMARAQKRLKTLPTSQKEYFFSQGALARAKARLEAKAKAKKNKKR